MGILELTRISCSPAGGQGRNQKMKRMLINGLEEGECRVAVMDGGRLEELYVERGTRMQTLGGVYRGRVANVERGIQSAFVDIGTPQHGFLHVNDALFPAASGPGDSGLPGPRAKRPKARIEDILAPGRWVLVQVTKEASGSKGPALTTNVSLPGRYLILMPFWGRIGLSRRIEDECERSRLQEVLEEMEFPPGMGGIIRTAGQGMRKADFRRDLGRLLRLWRDVQGRAEGLEAPGAVYEESELAIRVLRDFADPDVEEIVVDSKDLFRKAKDYLNIMSPRHKGIVRLYEGADPLFHGYGVEKEIERVFERRVALRSGGSVVIEQTEALAAIDVNSGAYRKGGSVEETALAVNLEAAEEIARQIRLRDLGGVIVVDFIDMKDRENRRAVEKAFKKAMSADRARAKVLRMSDLCLLELTRRRQKQSLATARLDPCPACQGAGFVLSDESLALSIIRDLRHSLRRDDACSAEVEASRGAAEILLNGRKADIAEIEARTGKGIVIAASESAEKGVKRLRLLGRDGAEIGP